ncbi:MAG: transcriptional repressor LexA [Dehalococcoidia bacterium]|nr:transcriptional repressor LexA [Dehalococcoidia bacterium]MDW8009567.1 transcriptional repressor LexA [Chloroflexota bacterium]
MRELTPKQRRILEFIRRFIEEHDYPPSIRQIQEGCGLSSTSVVDYNLRILERLGYIRRDREVSRAIELLGPAGRRRPRLVPVPLVGTIAAGQPIPVPGEDAWSPSWEEVLELPADMVGNRENVFAVRVKGNSMVDALVYDGDIVVLEQTSTARDGEMVAAWLKREGEATLKRIYREGERVRLQPANEAMAPIYTEADNVEVQGRVVAVLRSMS